jgi:hypothetical protein
VRVNVDEEEQVGEGESVGLVEVVELGVFVFEDENVVDRDDDKVLITVCVFVPDIEVECVHVTDGVHGVVGVNVSV